MKKIKMAIIVAAAAAALIGAHDVMARGGGGGGRGGGGWSGGGRGGGRGGEWRGGGGGEHGRGDHGRGRWNGYNNNVYGAVGYDDGWGYGASDDAMGGLSSDTYIDDSTESSTVVIQQPTASANDAMAGLDSGQAIDNSAKASTVVIQQPAAPIVPIGAQVTMLPPGSQGRSVSGAQLYQCGSVWYKPYFGASGVYYEVVPQP